MSRQGCDELGGCACACGSTHLNGFEFGTPLCSALSRRRNGQRNGNGRAWCGVKGASRPAFARGVWWVAGVLVRYKGVCGKVHRFIHSLERVGFVILSLNPNANPPSATSLRTTRRRSLGCHRAPSVACLKNVLLDSCRLPVQKLSRHLPNNVLDNSANRFPVRRRLPSQRRSSWLRQRAEQVPVLSQQSRRDEQPRAVD